ncbi:MAG: hypothetical protein ACRETX_16630 [Steroidobacteraceae bacterium]
MTLDPIERTSLALSAGAVVFASAFLTPLIAMSLATGAVLATANFHGLRAAAVATFRGELDNRMLWNALFALRFTLLAVAIGIATRVGVDPTGLVVGLSLVVPAAFIEAWRTRPAIDPNAPALDPDDEAWDRWNPWLAREIEDREDDA